MSSSQEVHKYQFLLESSNFVISYFPWSSRLALSNFEKIFAKCSSPSNHCLSVVLSSKFGVSLKIGQFCLQGKKAQMLFLVTATSVYGQSALWLLPHSLCRVFKRHGLKDRGLIKINFIASRALLSEIGMGVVFFFLNSNVFLTSLNCVLFSFFFFFFFYWVCVTVKDILMTSTVWGHCLDSY